VEERSARPVEEAAEEEPELPHSRSAQRPEAARHDLVPRREAAAQKRPRWLPSEYRSQCC
jgi:hypothetical protein